MNAVIIGIVLLLLTAAPLAAQTTPLVMAACQDGRLSIATPAVTTFTQVQTMILPLWQTHCGEFLVPGAPLRVLGVTVTPDGLAKQWNVLVLPIPIR